MDSRALERLGQHVVSRRVALGFRTRIDLASSLQFTVRTLSDIEHGVRKASPGTYAMLENKLAWAPGSINTILDGGEPDEVVPALQRTNPAPRTSGYGLRPTNTNALSQVPTEELLLELRRRIIAPRGRRQAPGTTGTAASTRTAIGPKSVSSPNGCGSTNRAVARARSRTYEPLVLEGLKQPVTGRLLVHADPSRATPTSMTGPRASGSSVIRAQKWCSAATMYSTSSALT